MYCTFVTVYTEHAHYITHYVIHYVIYPCTLNSGHFLFVVSQSVGCTLFSSSFCISLGNKKNCHMHKQNKLSEKKALNFHNSNLLSHYITNFS